MKKYLENFHPRWRHSVRTRWNIDIKMSSAEKLFISFTESASKPRRFILLKTEKKNNRLVFVLFFFFKRTFPRQQRVASSFSWRLYSFFVFCFFFILSAGDGRSVRDDRRRRLSPANWFMWLKIPPPTGLEASRTDRRSVRPSKKNKQNTHEIPTIGKRRRASFVTAKGFEVHALDTQTVKRNSTRSTQ